MDKEIVNVKEVESEVKPEAKEEKIETKEETVQSIDYEKLADILDGRIKATEDSVLKGYFKDQGLTGEEMAQAISAFKEDKASKEPDIEGLNAKLEEANKKALDAEMKLKANGIANDLEVPSTKVPYLLKMADTDDTIIDGEISEEKLKQALEVVLDDVPELKTVKEEQPSFTNLKIGVEDSKETENKDSLDSQLATAFGVKLK